MKLLILLFIFRFRWEDGSRSSLGPFTFYNVDHICMGANTLFCILHLLYIQNQLLEAYPIVIEPTIKTRFAMTPLDNY